MTTSSQKESHPGDEKSIPSIETSSISGSSSSNSSSTNNSINNSSYHSCREEEEEATQASAAVVIKVNDETTTEPNNDGDDVTSPLNGSNAAPAKVFHDKSESTSPSNSRFFLSKRKRSFLCLMAGVLILFLIILLSTTGSSKNKNESSLILVDDTSSNSNNNQKKVPEDESSSSGSDGAHDFETAAPLSNEEGSEVEAVVDEEPPVDAPTTSGPTSASTTTTTTTTTQNPTKSPSTQNPTTANPTASTPITPLPTTTSPTTDSPTTKPPTSRPTSSPTDAPTDPKEEDLSGITYRPGNLIHYEAGLLLSEGLRAREIASSGEKVQYANGDSSKNKFHDLPDGGETFPDTRDDYNPNGWIYVSNSEMPDRKDGGVGAITFDKDGNILDYQMVLEKTTMNCGGGATPWNTWISCEELEYDEQIYQVDPTGQREAEVLTLGNRGGRWEAFAYDVRDRDYPRFFASEDHNRGCVRRFTPARENVDWEEPWDMLHGDGSTEFLILSPNPGQDGGTFEWSSDKEAARENAKLIYPQTEGIDCHEDQLFFVCKNIRQIFTVNLDDGTYTNATTVTGLFDGKPDQMQRILDDPTSILYFTEEGGVDAGVHARDATGGYYTILEGPDYNDETSGLAFSPDAMHMYIAFQMNGKLFDVWREDGMPFNARRLDVKYHGMGLGR